MSSPSLYFSMIPSQASWASISKSLSGKTWVGTCVFCGRECVGGCMHERASRGRNFINWYFVQIWVITGGWYILWWLCLLVIENRSLFDYSIYIWWLDLFGDRKHELFLELILMLVPSLWWWWGISSLVSWLSLLEIYFCHDWIYWISLANWLFMIRFIGDVS